MFSNHYKRNAATAEPVVGDALDMREVAEAFIDALNHTLAAYIDPDMQAKAKEFIVNLVVENKPYMMVTPEGTGALAKEVFTDALIQDLVLTLFSNFSVRWPSINLKLIELVNVMSWGVSADQNQNRLCLVPDQIRSRLTPREDAVAVLTENMWLLTLLLMKSFVRIDQNK